jgi:putative DNA primase/helicase
LPWEATGDGGEWIMGHRSNGNGKENGKLEQVFQLAADKGLDPIWSGDHQRIVFKSPLRNDRKASAFAMPGDDGNPVFGDHGSTLDKGDTHREIAERLGYVGKRPRNVKTVDLVDANWIPPQLGWKGAKVTAIHGYFNELSGDETTHKLLGQLVRFVMPDGSKEPRLRRPVEGKWAWTWDAMYSAESGNYYPPVRRVLYNLPALLAAEKVYIGEGEKVVDCLIARGLVATTNPGGACKWSSVIDQAREVLKGKHVVILPDKDKKGEQHVRMVAASLLGYAASVKVLMPFDDVGEGDDVVDWFAKGHTLEELLKLEAETPKLEREYDNIPVTHDTHKGNAELLKHQEGERIIHVHGTDRTYIYNGSVWEWDRSDQLRLIASDTIANYFFYQEKIARDIGDGKLADRLEARALKGEDRRTIDNTLTFFRAMVAKSLAELDADPWLLNIRNGTLCLELDRFDFRPHDPGDYLTKQAPVEWRGEDAECPLWLKCLDRWFAGDQTLIRFVQHYLGYCLTGDISAQYFVIFYGAGRNGKNVLLDTVMSIMGAYADEAAPGILEASKNDRHPTEIMDLMGKHFVVASETESGSQLRQQLIKRATGNPKMKGRFMRADWEDFIRRFKLLLVTNNKPRITEDSEAMWGRILLVYFGVVIPEHERDPDLTRKLRDEWPGILAWLVKGCLDWQRNGKRFEPPSAVLTATTEYRQEENPVGRFVEECCEVGEDFKVPASTLYQSYSDWCHRAGSKPYSDRKFSEALKRGERFWKGSIVWKGANNNRAMGWKGIRPRSARM